MEEIWKDIEGYEGIYQVSNLGNVKSLDRTVKYTKWQYKLCKVVECKHLVKGKTMIPWLNDTGYLVVDLSSKGKTRSYLVHRLVAQAFIDNPENKPEVNHKDGNRQNPEASNLEWVTSSENKIHAYRTGLHVVSDETRSKLSESAKNRGYVPHSAARKAVKCLETGEMYVSMEDARLRSGASADLILASIRDGESHYSKKLGKWLTFVRVQPLSAELSGGNKHEKAALL